MKLKLQLVRDGEILFEIPLSPEDWPRDELVNDLNAFEADFQRFSQIFTALSNETRFMMMKQFIKKRSNTITFSDFMRDLDLNPKIVWENTRKLREGGFIEKVGRGKYRCSEFGESGFMMMSLALKRLLGVLEEFENY